MRAPEAFEAVVSLLRWASVKRPLTLVVEDLHAAWAELLMALQLQQLQRGVGEQHTRHCGPPSGVQNASIDVPNNKVERERQRDRQSERGKERQRAYILEAPY